MCVLYVGVRVCMYVLPKAGSLWMSVMVGAGPGPNQELGIKLDWMAGKQVLDSLQASSQGRKLELRQNQGWNSDTQMNWGGHVH